MHLSNDHNHKRYEIIVEKSATNDDKCDIQIEVSITAITTTTAAATSPTII